MARPARRTFAHPDEIVLTVTLRSKALRRARGRSPFFEHYSVSASFCGIRRRMTRHGRHRIGEEQDPPRIQSFSATAYSPSRIVDVRRPRYRQ